MELGINFTIEVDILFEKPGITILFPFIIFLYPNEATSLDVAVSGLLNNREDV